MMTETDARQKVRAFIVENFLYTRPEYPFGDEESLLRKGIVDSLGITEVIEFVQGTWGVQVPEDDITEANFGSVAGIARYVASAQQGRGSDQLAPR